MKWTYWDVKLTCQDYSESVMELMWILESLNFLFYPLNQKTSLTCKLSACSLVAQTNRNKSKIPGLLYKISVFDYEWKKITAVSEWKFVIKIKIESVEHSHVGGVGGVELVRGEVLYCTRMPPSTPSVWVATVWKKLGSSPLWTCLVL